METITQSTPLLAAAFNALMMPPYNWTQADIDGAVDLINQSPLLVSQLLDGTLPCFFDNMLKYIKTIVAVWACNAHESP
jgi:hypothetical protein